MKIRRILASSITGLLLLFTPLAVACDLSCAFSSMESDCHSGRAAVSQGSDSSGMNMAGMEMAGMDMSMMAVEMGQAGDSAIASAQAAHPAIGDMGPCEKQVCDSRATISTYGSKSGFGNLHFRVLVAIPGARLANARPALFRIARDETTQPNGADGISLHLNLRI